MKKAGYAREILCLTTLLALGCGSKGTQAEANAPPAPPPPPGPPGCGLMQGAAFCDTFDTASPGGRNGDLDDANWSVARISTPGARGVFEPWANATALNCGESKTGVIPGQDIVFCAGGGTPSMHMNDTEDDGGGFTIHSYRVRKLFDFTDRTGVISFDVGAKGQVPGGHGFWFNLVIADEPVPAPYQQGGGIALFAKAAVLIEFEAAGAGTECAADGTQNSISAVYVEKDYKITDTYNYLYDRNPQKVCLKTKEEVMNHVEIHISKTSIEVFGSDADDPGSFRSLVTVDSEHDHLNLPLTKGYVNFQQTHYNAAKNEVTPSYATYHWDNIAFDGPSYKTPRAYEVKDSNKQYTLDVVNAVGQQVKVQQTDVGYQITQSGLKDHDGPVASIGVKGVDLTDAASAMLTLNAWNFCPGDTLDYRLNGGEWKSYQCPFPLACDGCGDGNTPAGQCDASARAVNMPVDLADIKQGDNSLELRTSSGDTNSDSVVANAELVINPNQ